MATQGTNGKGFEWAVASACKSILGIKIEESSSNKVAFECYLNLPSKKKEHFDLHAIAAAKHIVEKEHLSIGGEGFISLAPDQNGMVGDVIDVLIVSNKHRVGISCKTNHDAVKHSRLSAKIDFVKVWGIDEAGCSDDYWNAVRPIFEDLRLKKDESNSTALWAELGDVPVKVYWPILAAFEAEVFRTCKKVGDVLFSKAFVSYLIGKNDFYKVISESSQVEIQAFNFNRTLNSQKTQFPTALIGIDTKNGGQYSKTIRFNAGFTFNFRIHSASSKIEPSLKFDVRAISTPDRYVYNHTIDL